jgi:hypothetical protein
MSAITFACIAVLAIVGLAVYAIHRKACLKVSAKAPGKFEVNIEVTSQTGAHHGRLPSEPGDKPRSLGKPDNPTRADKSASTR